MKRAAKKERVDEKKDAKRERERERETDRKVGEEEEEEATRRESGSKRLWKSQCSLELLADGRPKDDDGISSKKKW